MNREFEFGKDIFLKTKKDTPADFSENIKPFGAVCDYSTGIEFGKDLIDFFKKNDFTLLDLGTSTGTVPFTMRQLGIKSIGLEGSINPKKYKLGAWKDYPEIVENADISQEFQIVDNENEIIKFDFITGMEVFEHIEENKLPMVFQNIKNHLSKNGYCIASIFPNTCPVGYNDLKQQYNRLGLDIQLEPFDGMVDFYHKTIKPEAWWDEILSKYFIIDNNIKIVRNWRYPRHSYMVWLKHKNI